MPIYEFACQDCGYEFEKIQSFSDSSTPSCPNCQGIHVQRRLSAPAIHFKGSGWYITDSKAAKTSATGGAGGAEGDGAKGEPAKAETGKGDTGKTETNSSETPAATPAAKASETKATETKSGKTAKAAE